MSDFLKLLPLELSMIDEESLLDPGEVVHSGERVVGEATLEQRRIYSLGKRWMKESLDILSSLILDSNDAEEKLTRSHELRDKSDVLARMFWVLVQDDLKLWGQSVGVRRGYQIVLFDDPESDLRQDLRELFGR